MSDIIPESILQNKRIPETTFIYVLIEPETNEVRYVGKADNIQKRLAGHLREKEDFYKNRWLRDLKSRGLKPSIEVVEEVSYGLWQERERFWIAYYKSQGCHLTNTSEGGIGNNGVVLSDEAKAKISAAHKGKKRGKQPPRSKEWSENISKAKKGKKQTPETIAKQAASRVGKRHSPETRAKIAAANTGKKRPELSAAMKGHKASEETRSKLSASLTGRKLKPESIAKRSASVRGKKRPPEFGAKIAASKTGKKRAPFSEEWRKKLGDASRARHAANRAMKNVSPDTPTLWG